MSGFHIHIFIFFAHQRTQLRLCLSILTFLFLSFLFLTFPCFFPSLESWMTSGCGSLGVTDKLCGIMIIVVHFFFCWLHLLLNEAFQEPWQKQVSFLCFPIIFFLSSDSIGYPSWVLDSLRCTVICC